MPSMRPLLSLKKRPSNAALLLEKRARGDLNDRSIPSSYFSDDRLLMGCPRCNNILRLNPFIVRQPKRLPRRRNPVPLTPPVGAGRKGSDSASGDRDEGNDDESDAGQGSLSYGPIIINKKVKKFDFNIVSFRPTTEAHRRAPTTASPGTQ